MDDTSLASRLCLRFRVAQCSEIGWAHAVNNVADLRRALADPTVHMIEADISWDSELRAAVMQHPGAPRGEIFEDWVAAFLAGGEARKGLKLDFKDLDAVEQCLIAVNKQNLQAAVPIWLNADILDGPCGAPARVDQQHFIDLCTKHCSESTLSLGWSTRTPSPDNPDGYSSEHVARMWAVCSRLPESTYVTFPVRATSVIASPESAENLRQLLAHRPNTFSLTLWGRISDEGVERLTKEVNASSTFFDIQDEAGTQRAAKQAALTATSSN